MTRLTPTQAAHLKALTAQRSKVERALERAEALREELDHLIRKGRKLGISTYRMANATGLSQPRVQQIARPPAASKEKRL